jgi:hypothetical protein
MSDRLVDVATLTLWDEIAELSHFSLWHGTCIADHN